MTVWLAETLQEGRPVFRIGRDADDLIAEWVGVGTLTVDRAGTMPRFSAELEADPLVVAKLKAAAVPALLRHLRRQITLHASAVAFGGGAIALLGDSGAGKSTLAFALATSEAHSFSLLCDDCLSVDDGLALPTDRCGWLDNRAQVALNLPNFNEKSAVTPRRVGEQAVPLRLVVELAYADAIRLTPLTGNAVAAVLSRALIRFVLDEPEVHRVDLDQLSELASKVDVLRLERPKGFEHLNATIAELEKALW